MKSRNRIDPGIEAILDKGEALEGLGREDAVRLLSLPLLSPEIYALMETANRISRILFQGKGELHFHIGLNVQACPYDCLFCSLSKKADIFKEESEFSEEKILSWAIKGEDQGADALNLMTTGTYSFDKLLDIGRMLRERVDVPLVANTRDISHKEGEQLLKAGFTGFYHAVRLGEGRDTPFSRERRLETIQVLRDVGLKWMNCIEPVGPEHDIREIADLMVLARKMGATYSGVMRRINFPGSPKSEQGMITELEMARMVAVSRLVMGDIPLAHCTHEPHTASLLAGANLFFPEVGSSPRDSAADTGKGRGFTIPDCKRIFREMGWDPDLSSNCFGKSRNAANHLQTPPPCPSSLFVHGANPLR